MFESTSAILLCPLAGANVPCRVENEKWHQWRVSSTYGIRVAIETFHTLRCYSSVLLSILVVMKT